MTLIPIENSPGVVYIKEGYESVSGHFTKAIMGNLRLFTNDEVGVKDGKNSDTWGIIVRDLHNKTRHVILGCQIEHVEFFTKVPQTVAPRVRNYLETLS